jgi:hypothetical protein
MPSGCGRCESGRVLGKAGGASPGIADRGREVRLRRTHLTPNGACRSPALGYAVSGRLAPSVRQQNPADRIGNVPGDGAFYGTTSGRIDRSLPRQASAAVEGLSDADSRRQAFGENQTPITSVVERKTGTLPGQSLLLFDPQRILIDGVVPCEDGHAQERSLLDQALPQLMVGTSPTRIVTGQGPGEGLVRSTSSGTNVAEESVRQRGNLSN